MSISNVHETPLAVVLGESNIAVRHFVEHFRQNDGYQAIK